MKSKKYKRRKKNRNFKFAIRRFIPKFLLVLKIFIGLLVVVVAGHFAFFSGYFNISNIEIKGADRFVGYEDIMQVSTSSVMHQNLLLFKKDEFQKKLADTFLGAQSISTKKKLPNTLQINVTERTPIAILYKDSTDEQFLVDKDGYVLGYTLPENDNLPKIKYEKDISVGLFTDKNLVPFYRELTHLLEQEDIYVSSMSFHPKHVSFSLDGGENVLIGLEKDILEAVKSLAALLTQTGIENKVIERIDLRYDKVIVLFK